MIVYDGSLEGFVTALMVASERKEEFTCDESLFGGEKIESDGHLVEEWFHQVREKYGEDVIADFMALFFSEREEREDLSLAYFHLLHQKGTSLRHTLQDPVVYQVMKNRRAYFFEVHRFQGLVRFREQNGWLYGPIEPDYHILPYLWKHFHRRLPKEKWILHDVRRDIAVIHDNIIHWATGFTLCKEAIHFSEKEKEIQTLWKQFYQSITIPERKNLRQQRQMMPKKYWRYLVEKDK